MGSKEDDNSEKTDSAEESETKSRAPLQESSSEFRDQGNLRKLISYLWERTLSFNIGHLLLILLAFHLLAMTFPNDGGKVFDESYYIPASKDLLSFTASNLEHPFFGKIWGAIGIYFFGDNFFGWRIFYVIFGVFTVWVFYEISKTFFSKEKSLFAASFLGFETLFFVHTSLLLLEGPTLFFGLLGFLLYFKKRYYFSALAFGLSVLSKEWGIYFVAALFLYHIYTTRRVPITRRVARRIFIFAVIVAAIILLPLEAYDLAYHPSFSSHVVCSCALQNFIYYYDYHTSLTIANYSTISQWNNLAWNWILPLRIDPSGAIVINKPDPMGYFVTTVTVTIISNGHVVSVRYLHPIDWLGMGNLVIWYSILLIVPIAVLKLIARKVSELDVFLISWIIATYGPSLVLSAFFHRIVYPFYFINVDPALALGIPMVVTFVAPNSMGLQRFLLLLWLGAAILLFVLFFPVHPLDHL